MRHIREVLHSEDLLMDWRLGMKTYKYTCFLRNPHTLDARHFNIEIDWQESEFMDFPSLINNLHEIIGQLPEGYTLIGMNCIDVIAKGEPSEE